MNQSNSSTHKLSIFLIILAALIFAAVLLSKAMQAGGWMFAGLIVGIVVIFALSVKGVSFIVRQYVIWTEAKVKSQEAQNAFLLNMAKAGLVCDEEGLFKPIRVQQIAAPAPKPKDAAPADPRKKLLIELCLLTIRSNKRDDKTGELIYGPTSRRLMTADDAQKLGGVFSDRSQWEKASQYGQDNYLVYEKRGGNPQGMMVDNERAGGTVGELMSVLMRSPVLDEAVAALPGIER